MWIHLSYYITLSLVGYLALKVSKLKTTSFRSSGLDLFFTSVFASTVSSMSTMEMEIFSNIQLVIMTILMLLGGEIFTSFLELQLLRSKYFSKRENIETRVHVNASNVEKFVNQVELDLATLPQSQNEKPDPNLENGSGDSKYCSISVWVVWFFVIFWWSILLVLLWFF